MKTETLLDLVDKWERKSLPDNPCVEYENSEGGIRQSGFDDGYRHAMKDCAENATLLVKLLS